MGLYGGRCSKIAQLNCSIMRIYRRWCVPSLNKRHHFLTFPSFFAPSPHTSTICLWINTRQAFLLFKNHITSCTSSVVRFSIFMFTFNGCSKCEKKLWHHTLKYMCFPWHKEDDWPSQEVSVSSVQRLYAVSSYFLGIPCIFLQGFSGQGDIGNLLSVSVKSKSCFSKQLPKPLQVHSSCTW